jgi:hypothetical protein
MAREGGLVIDPVSLAVFALAQALIKAAAQGAGEAAGTDAYHAMKARILRKYPAASASIEKLEEEPYSQERRERVAATLHSLGGSNDPELAQLADQLMSAVQNGYQDAPPVQPNQHAEHAYSNDRVAQSKRLAGIRAVNQMLGEHIRRVSDLRSYHVVDNSSLLSSSISRARDVPAGVRDEVAALHGRIRQIIAQVAWSIENGRYQHTESSLQNLASRHEQERAMRLVQADKAICVSYETLRLTVDFFSELNGQVLERTAREPSAQRQNQMMFGNAIMIYELADFMIGFIRGFAPGGEFELEALHEETLERIRKAKNEQQRQAERARHDDIEPPVRASILDNLKQTDAALEVLQQEWETYVAQTRQLHDQIAEVQNKIPTLELIRDNARLQLDVLELVAMIRFLRQNDEAVRAAVRTLHGLRLVPLTPDRVRRLVGTGA